MQLTRLSRLVIVFGTSIAIFGLMMVTVDPQVQYSVDEVMGEPERFENDNIFVRGIVLPGSMDYDELVFILQGSSEQLIVDFNDSPIPMALMREDYCSQRELNRNIRQMGH